MRSTTYLQQFRALGLAVASGACQRPGWQSGSSSARSDSFGEPKVESIPEVQTSPRPLDSDRSAVIVRRAWGLALTHVECQSRSSISFDSSGASNPMKIRPLQDRLIVKRVAEE